ncbi:MAG: galactose-1-phosphate uridylyltransferase [Spirochaetales bacterium]|nr:galactose-1-phosphate uridylyltransferase [Spirochaetales bacterium]
MHEIRQNKVTREWVIFSTARGKRPRDFAEKAEGGRPSPIPPHDKHCPFCAGNEERLGEIILEVPAKNEFGFQTRVIPNKYPALVPELSSKRSVHGIYLHMPGYGRHEVIVESPYHNGELAMMPHRELSLVIETYHQRYCELLDDERNMMVLIFRNHGEKAGASLVHPHSQIIATGVVPNGIRFRNEEAQRYFDEWNRCVFCDVIRFEEEDGRRVVYSNDLFLAFVPFAAEVPCEVWIIPRRHQASFSEVDTPHKQKLTEALSNILGRLFRAFGDLDYNFIIHSSVRFETDEPQLHWYLQIRPRLTTQAGFELGSRININTSLPEDDAAFLNAVQ